jgi:hypothetical protein
LADEVGGGSEDGERREDECGGDFHVVGIAVVARADANAGRHVADATADASACGLVAQNCFWGGRV